MKIKELTINKPSAMIQTNAKGLNLTQRKIINILIKNAQSSENSIEYTIPLKTVKSLCGISSHGNDELKDHILRLQKIIIVFNYLGKDNKNIWDSNVLLPRVKIDKNSGIVKYEFTSFVRKQLISPSMYAPLNVLLIASFQSKHTIILYEFLRDYLNAPAIPKLSMEDFRKLLGLDDGKYKEFPDFKRRVIDIAVNEINVKSDIKCSYELIKEIGNKYSHIKFKVKGEAKVKQIEQKIYIPNQIIFALPEKYRIESIYDIIRKHLIEPYDLDFIISNIKYSAKDSIKNFSSYLQKSLENDYAKTDREIKEKTIQMKEKQEKLRLKKEQEKLEEKRKQEEEMKNWEAVYNSLTNEKLEKYKKKVKLQLEKDEIPSRYINDILIKGMVVELIKKEKEK